ncbi:retrovirus-related pol polyprotein from transposon TNT 1-94 [Tanacetum coccineum]
MKNDKVIALGMFRIAPSKTSREDKFVPINKARVNVRTKSITVSQPYVITKKDVNSDSNGLSSIGVDITAKTRRSQPRSNTKNDRVPSASKSSCIKNKELAIRNDKFEVVCAIFKQCLITANHDVCVLNYVNVMNSRANKPSAHVSKGEIQKKHEKKAKKPKKLSDFECQSDNSKGDNACTSNPMEPTSKWFPNSTFSLAGTLRFGNDHIATILGYGDLQYGNLEVAFRRNTCFVRNLEGVDLLKGNHSTNLYTINLHEMATASRICDIARATSTKSWLWHQRLSHLNFDTINELAKNDLITSLPKFKYHKEHLCPLCEQGKSKSSPHKPKHVPNLKQRLHLLHMDLCGPMRVESINGKQYVLVIVDDYFRYTWVHFLRSKDKAPEEIKTFLKKIQVLLQAPVIILRTDNGTEFKNQVLKEYFDDVGISHQTSSVKTP